MLERFSTHPTLQKYLKFTDRTIRLISLGAVLSSCGASEIPYVSAEDLTAGGVRERTVLEFSTDRVLVREFPEGTLYVADANMSSDSEALGNIEAGIRMVQAACGSEVTSLRRNYYVGDNGYITQTPAPRPTVEATPVARANESVSSFTNSGDQEVVDSDVKHAVLTAGPQCMGKLRQLLRSYLPTGR